MDYEKSIIVRAPVERVWTVLSDLDRWPEWTESIDTLRRLDAAPLGPGSRVRIKQPKLPAAAWTVKTWQPPSYFDWVSKTGLVTSVAGHRVVHGGGGGSIVTLTLHQSGLGSLLFGPLLRRIARRYMEMEAEGLKRRAEAE